MSLGRYAALAMSELRTRVKFYALDTSTTSPKFGNDELTNAINNSAVELQVRSRRPPTKAIETEDLTYTASSEAVEVPANVGHQALYQVMDITNPDAPTVIAWSPVNLVHQPNVVASRGGGMTAQRRRWTLLDGITPNWRARIAIFPVPTAEISLRLYYLQRALVSTGTDGDLFWMAPEWQELCALGAARRLRGTHQDEFSAEFKEMYQEQMRLFEEQAGGYLGLQKIPRRRYGRR